MGNEKNIGTELSVVANISIDFDSVKSEIYLLGDIAALQKNRFAWRYVKDFLHPIISEDRIIIPVDNKDTFSVMSKISSMLAKYGFSEVQSENSEKVVQEYYEEEKRFAEFSKKALHIRNNECDAGEFERFTQSVAKTITWLSLKMHVTFRYLAQAKRALFMGLMHICTTFLQMTPSMSSVF